MVPRGWKAATPGFVDGVAGVSLQKLQQTLQARRGYETMLVLYALEVFSDGPGGGRSLRSRGCGPNAREILAYHSG
ncbi:hypothetical protein [Hyperthermus butylicus]|uniref:hypothetical protein n=1 Tax=Hyperthermus butylicus TaxID=54248 RepID=UPI0003250521|nr:hypothetical protein [Hyperthermus butylicus]